MAPEEQNYQEEIKRLNHLCDSAKKLGIVIDTSSQKEEKSKKTESIKSKE